MQSPGIDPASASFLNEYSIRLVNPKDQNDFFNACREIREKVFVDEQAFNLEDEFDDIDKDPDTIHVLLYHHSAPTSIGTLRYSRRPKQKLSRIAILKSHRGKGAGTALIRLFEQELFGHPDLLTEQRITLHSQIPVIPFYRKLGFKTEGEVFLEDGQVHQAMVKKLQMDSMRR